MQMQQRMKDLIGAQDDDTLLIAGRPLPAPGEARAWAERLQSELAKRFAERRPNATEHTWHRFQTLLTAYAGELDRPSAEALEDLWVLIDGL